MIWRRYEKTALEFIAVIVVRQGSYVFQFVCFFVCLLAALCKNYSTAYFSGDYFQVMPVLQRSPPSEEPLRISGKTEILKVILVLGIEASVLNMVCNYYRSI